MKKNILFYVLFIVANLTYAQEVIYSEDFNNEATWSDWTLADLDGDGEFWELDDAEFQGLDSFTGGFVWSFSWYFEVFTPDNTLTSPTISLPEEGALELTFKVGVFDDEEQFQEHYAVYVIPSDTEFIGNEEPVFEETLDAPYYLPPKTVNVDISEYAGQEVQLVFRHYESTDIFYIAMDDIVITQNTLGITDKEQSTVKIYPNPTTEIISIHGLDAIIGLRIFDLQGKLLKETTKEKVLNLSQLSSGTYLLNIYTETEVYSRKIIKE